MALVFRLVVQLTGMKVTKAEIERLQSTDLSQLMQWITPMQHSGQGTQPCESGKGKPKGGVTLTLTPNSN